VNGLQSRYQRAFVIELRADSTLAPEKFEGRVEHMASYRARHFHSLDELLDFIATVLAEGSNTEQT
jgi:hypothetical protein